MYRPLLCALAALLTLGAAAQSRYLEADSAGAIQRRTADDFSYTMPQALKALQEKYPGFTEADLQEAIAKNYVEVKDIDGEQRMFAKSVRNYGLVNPRLSGFTNRGQGASPDRWAAADTVINHGNPWRTITYNYTITVPPQPEFAQGGTIRVWMPKPLVSERQKRVYYQAPHSQPSWQANRVIGPTYTPHNSIYFEQPASATDTLTFSATVTYDVRGAYYHPDSIKTHIKPYDTQSALYQAYTQFEAPHIIRLDSLAHAIVGDETCPYRQSELVFDWIASRYPWAGAREYSTIECIPQYVLDRGYGDCGQVSLLYISLMRSLGVPAAWESGWYMLPGEVGIHDWAKVYFEGVGWVPVDMSFGRFTGQDDPQIRDFHSHGIDPWRLAANTGVCGQFEPQKQAVRSETVDQQMGEVEFVPADGSAAQNLFYPLFKRRMKVLKVK